MQKMELENANLKEAHMTIAEKMGKQNASWKEAKIANGGKNRKRIHGRNRCKLEGGDTICGEYRQMKCSQGQGKMPNAAHMETN